MCPTDGELPRHKGEHGTCGRSPGTQGTASHLWITIDHMLDPEVNDWLTTAFCIQWFSFHLDAAVVHCEPHRHGQIFHCGHVVRASIGSQHPSADDSRVHGQPSLAVGG